MQCTVRVDLRVPELIVYSPQSSSRSKEFEDAKIQSKLPAAVAKEAKGSIGARSFFNHETSAPIVEVY